MMSADNNTLVSVESKQNGEDSPSQSILDEYLGYLRSLKAAWTDVPTLSIAYRDFSYTISVPLSDINNEIPNLAKFTLGLLRSLTFRSKPKADLHVLNKVTGYIPAGSMTLVLAPGGGGKSALLKALAGRIKTNDPHRSGSLLFNGQTQKEAQSNHGLQLHKLTGYVAQHEAHMAQLTVRETLQFAVENAVADPALLDGSNKELIDLHHKKVEMLFDVLGMKEASETIAGNALMRGISGGQKRRLTIGEMMITNARVLLLDEITNGLDAAVARDIVAALRQWTEITGGTVVSALLQPTPEVYALFDTLILLRQGAVVYHGPRDRVEEYLNSLGFIPPTDQDMADFIIDWLTDPKLVLQLQKKRQAHDRHKAEQLKQSTGTKPGETSEMKSQEGQVEKSNLIQIQSRIPSAIPDSRDRAASTVEEVVWHNDDSDHFTTLVPTNNTSDSDPLLKTQSIPTDDIPLTQAAIVSRWQASEIYQQLLTQLDEAGKPGRATQSTTANSPNGNNNGRALVSHTSSRASPAAASASSLNSNRNFTRYTQAQFQQPYTHTYWEHTVYSTRRQFLLLKRDVNMAPARIGSSIFMALVFGSLFYQLLPTNFYSKIGIALFAVLFCAFGNFTELPSAEEGRNTIYKQADSGFMPTISYIIANVIVYFPMLVAETTLFGTILYWMVGFDSDAGRYFFFLFLNICMNLAISAMFRSAVYSVANQLVAQQVINPLISVQFLFGGFLITRKHIQNWLIEFYYLSPYSWGVTAVAQNEFQDQRYSAPALDANGNPTGETTGNSDLEAFEIPTDPGYKWGAIGFLIGNFIVFIILCAWLLHNKRFEVQLGTKRQELEDVEIQVDEEVLDVAPSQVDAAVPTPFGTNQIKSHNSSQGKSYMNRSNRSNRSGKTAASVLPFTPIDLVFRNIKYTIDVQTVEKKTIARTLLTDVSGFVRPGQLVALMGSSGAGKTTLMDVIAMRKTSGKIEGEILINGFPQDPATFKRLSGYVEQQDIHMGLSTVRESLMFSANLRLPRSTSEEQRSAFVDEILGLLEMKPLADRIVGNESYVGLSPGQLKLLTIGTELVANPSLLFLDEPTSGLDSRSALMVMRVVRNIAATGRSVLCTIHQPSSEVFFMFDSLLLLRQGGRTVYFGDLGARGAEMVDYFQSQSSSRLPTRTNPASWMLDVIGAGIESKSKVKTDFADLYDQSELGRSNTKMIDQIAQPEPQSAPLALEGDFSPTLWTQIRCVYWRAFLHQWRDVVYNGGKCVVLTFLGIIFGLIYLQLSINDYAGVNNKIASVFMASGFCAIVQANGAMPRISFEKAVYYRERASDSYSSYVYSTAIGITEMPFVLLSAWLFATPFYFLIGFTNSASSYFMYIFAHYLFCLFFLGIGQLFAALMPNIVVAVQLSGLYFMMSFLFGGVFIHFGDIPTGWQWFYYLNCIPKAVIALVLPQLECHLPNPYDVNSGCPVIDVPNGSTTTTMTAHAYGNLSLSAGYGSYWNYIGWMVLSIVVVRMLIMLTLRYVSHLKR